MDSTELEMVFPKHYHDSEILLTYRGDTSKAKMYLSGTTRHGVRLIYEYSLNSEQQLIKQIHTKSSLSEIENIFSIKGQFIGKEAAFKSHRYYIQTNSAKDFVQLMDGALQQQPTNEFKRELSYGFFEGSVDEFKWAKSLLTRFKLDIKAEDFEIDENPWSCLIL